MPGLCFLGGELGTFFLEFALKIWSALSRMVVHGGRPRPPRSEQAPFMADEDGRHARSDPIRKWGFSTSPVGGPPFPLFRT